MTATPKIYNLAEKKGQEAKVAFDMSNEEIYGKQFFKFSLNEAIEKEILTDYRIILVGINAKSQAEQKLEFLKNNGSSPKIHAKLLAETMKKNNLTHVISYHSTVKKAQEMEAEFIKNNPDIYAKNVNGKQGTKEREAIINEFVKNLIALLTNARCLREGVDIPIVDGIYLADLISSNVTIAQILGRALRKHKGKSIATFIVPITDVPVEGSLEESAQSSRFQQVLNIVRALANEDESLQDIINQASSSKNKQDIEKSIEKLKQKIDFGDMEIDLTDAIVQEILGRNRTENVLSWDDKLGVLEFFIESRRVGDQKVEIKKRDTIIFNGKKVGIGHWFFEQTWDIEKGLLTGEKLEKFNKVAEKIEKKSKIVKLFNSYETLEEFWYKNLDTLELFIKKNKVEGQELRIKRRDMVVIDGEEISVGSWFIKQRKRKAEGKLTGEKLERFNEVTKGVELSKDPNETWEENLDAFELFLEDIEKVECVRRSPTVEENYQLRNWFTMQTADIKEGKLTGEKLERFNKRLKGFKSTYDELWKHKLKNLELFLERTEKEEGKRRVPDDKKKRTKEEGDLASWVRTQKSNIENNKLTKDELEAFYKVTKGLDLYQDSKKLSWENNFTTYKLFINGDQQLSDNEKTNIIKDWFANQKRRIKKNYATPEQIQKLQDIPEFKDWYEKEISQK